MNDSPHERSALPIGYLLRNGRYRIDEVLGAGGFGLTYKAWDAHLTVPVALKEFFPTGAYRETNSVHYSSGGGSDEGFDVALADFLREARLLARIRHANVVALLDHFEELGTGFMVMEFLAGHTYADVVTKHGPLSVPDCVAVLCGAGDGLAGVHRAGLVHRDIKPANVMGTWDGRIVLIDFGATRTSNNSEVSKALVSDGFSPLEQYSVSGLTTQSDIYSLAATGYFLLTGRRPLSAPQRAMHDSVLPVNQVRTEVPNHVSNAIAHALALRLDERPTHVEQFLEELRGSKAVGVTQSTAFVAPVGIARPPSSNAQAKEFSSNIYTTNVTSDQPPTTLHPTTAAPSVMPNVNLDPSKTKSKGKRNLIVALAAVAVIGVGVAAVAAQKNSSKQTAGETSSDTTTPSSSTTTLTPSTEASSVDSVLPNATGSDLTGSEATNSEGNTGSASTDSALGPTDGGTASAVPDLTGSEAQQARTVAQQQGLSVTIDYQYSSSIEKGYVVRQTPLAGTVSNTLRLTVSRGAPPKPNSTLAVTEPDAVDPIPVPANDGKGNSTGKGNSNANGNGSGVAGQAGDTDPSESLTAEQTVTQYYADISSRDFETAYNRLGPQSQAKQSFKDFSFFWLKISNIDVISTEALGEENGGTIVDVFQDLTRGDTVHHEHAQFTMEFDRSGWKIIDYVVLKSS
jgi:serine/threonine protein kinase